MEAEMKCKKSGNIYFIRIDRGEEIITELHRVCNEHQIKLGKISAIGAVNKPKIGFFELAKKQYHSKILDGDYEITSLLGNITTMNGDIYLHIHINLADDEHRTFGGHLNEAVVSATCEAIIEEFEGKVDRFFDKEIGINLIDV